MWRQVQWVDHTGSTNSDVAEAARSGEPEGLVVATLEQRAGRGRLNRAWVAPPGTSLAFSMLLEPDAELSRWGWLPLLTGMAVHEAIDDLTAETGRVQLKWPNDVLIDGRKVCGILSACVECPDRSCAVIGVGINVSIDQDQLPVPTATSLRIAGLDEDPERLLTSVLEHFQPLYQHWQVAGNIRDEYQRRCASIGTQLRIIPHAEQVVEGRGCGVDEDGRLQVATAAGIETFAVGDVVHAQLTGET
jgi:biotin--[acetyl-coA-carboxylase] ligase